MIDVAVFLALIALSAFFSASETSLFSLRDSQVRMMERRGELNARLIARLRSEPQRLLITILIGNNLTNITIASLATVVGIEYFDSFGAGIATGVSTVVILLLGEVFPKTLAISHKKKVAQWVAPLLALMFIICGPISHIFRRLERWVSSFAAQSPNIVSEEEIRIMVELGLEHGEIDHHERQMIENIFEFDDIPVKQIMTEKADIDSLSGEVPVDEIAYHVSQSGFSRFPVYEGGKGNYIGYVHTNDVMRVLNSDRRSEPMANFVAPITSVEETLNIRDVFRLMTRERSHLYLIHRKDDPDDILGLVTMEDILEEIVGDIEDEGDRRDRQRRESSKRGPA